MKISHSIVIRRPLAEVFAFVTDLRNETQWQPEIERVVLDGPLREGARFREVRRSFGLRFDWRFRITELDAPRRISIETISGWAPYRGTRSFEAVPGGTRVTESGELELPRALRPFEVLFVRMSAKPLREAYDRLAGMLEGRVPRTRHSTTMRAAHGLLEPLRLRRR